MSKSNKWLDLGMMIASFVIIALSVSQLISSGTLSVSLLEDEQLSWHLVRSSGMVAYGLLLASTVWGLFISSQFVKDWSPGPVSMTMHTTISWLALLLSLVHALLLMFDKYFTYTLGDIFIPFVGPYRPEVVGLGTLAFWLIIIVTLSFPLKKRLGHQNWKRLHLLSYLAFGMVSLHGLFAGTDGRLLGFRFLVVIGMVIVMFLLRLRQNKDQVKVARQH